jgi:hypothetical protein
MIIFKDLAFGDKVHVVNETNNVVRKKRITMTDVNGVEWSRYDREHWEYNIEELEYVGKVTFAEEGEVRFNEERQAEYHFMHPNGQIHSEYEDDDGYFLGHWFTSEEEAEDHITILKAERKGTE